MLEYSNSIFCKAQHFIHRRNITLLSSKFLSCNVKGNWMSEPTNKLKTEGNTERAVKPREKNEGGFQEELAWLQKVWIITRDSECKKGKDLSSLTNRLQRQIGGTVCSTGVTVTTAIIGRERHLRNGSKQNTDKGNIKGEQQVHTATWARIPVWAHFLRLLKTNYCHCQCVPYKELERQQQLKIIYSACLDNSLDIS